MVPIMRAAKAIPNGSEDNWSEQDSAIADGFALAADPNDPPTVAIDPGTYGRAGSPVSTGGGIVPAIIAVPGIGYVVVSQDGYDIFARQFDLAGNPLGSAQRVNSYTASDQTNPAAAVLSDGSFVIAWTSSLQDGDADGIYFQRFSGSGLPQGPETRANTTIFGSQQGATIAPLAGGGFLISWTSGANDDDVIAQRFDAQGAPQGAEVRINTTTTGSQSDPSAAGLEGGDYIVVWSGRGSSGLSNDIDIYSQRYDALGTPLGGETIVSQSAPYFNRAPSVTGLNDGGYVVAWTSTNARGIGTDISVQRYDSIGNPVGGEVRVALSGAANHKSPAVTSLADGGYVVTWSAYTYAYAQVFDASGNLAGSPILLSSTPGGPDYPAVAGVEDGTFAIAWTTGSGGSLLLQRFEGSFVSTEQEALSLKGTITIGDPDAGSGTITVTLAADYGIITAAPGGSGASVTGSGTGSVTLTGTIAQIQALLGNDAASILTYTADTDTPPASATLSVTVDDGGNSGDGGPQSATAIIPINITDVFDPITVTIDDVSVAEGDSGTVQLVFTVTRTGPIDAFRVNYTTADGTAVAFDDYTQTGGQLNFASGEMSKTIVVEVRGDTFTEGDETFFVRLTNPTNGAVLADNSGTGTIIDNDGTRSASGTAEADDISATTNEDWTILGLAGADILAGAGGNDTLRGGTDNDTLYGLGGNDSLFGDEGDDGVTAGAGNDYIEGGDGNDSLYGDSGNDVMYGGLGNDGLFGGDGDDQVNGGDGNDYVEGGIGNDTLIGGIGNDLVLGGAGNDGLFGGDGDDQLGGGDGNDYFDAGAGNDTLYGNAGNDVIYGGLGNDGFFGGAGVDRLFGGDGADYFEGGEETDIIYGEAGNDVVYGQGGVDNLYGGDGDDLLFADDGDDSLFGEGGNDNLYGGVGIDFMLGGDGNDGLFGGDGNDTMGGGTGNDYIEGGVGRDLLYGDAGSDVLIGGSEADWYGFNAALGADNVDTIVGFEAGLDKIYLYSSIFTGLAPGAVPAGAFVIGAAAADADDRILYDSATGGLFYDADGIGGVSAVQFATLAGAPVLSATDFSVV